MLHNSSHVAAIVIPEIYTVYAFFICSFMNWTVTLTGKIFLTTCLPSCRKEVRQHISLLFDFLNFFFFFFAWTNIKSKIPRHCILHR